MALVRGAAAASVLVFGTAFFLIASVLHVAILLTFFLLVYLGFHARLPHRAHLPHVQGFLSGLPGLPQQESAGGILLPKMQHRAPPADPFELRHSLPDLQVRQEAPYDVFPQRGELPAACPDCKHMLGGLIEVRKIFVPVFGGPAVGKSAFLSPFSAS